jgi:O-antigen/teichoic acid export membrane protein
MKSATWKLLRDSAWLIAAAQIGNVANLAFQVFMMHRLDDKEYGALAAMLGVAMALSLPMDAVRSWVAHVSARLEQGGRRVELAAWLTRAWRNAAIAALIVAGVFVLARHPLARWFGVGRGDLAAWTGALLAGALMSPVIQGALQGIQAFGAMSLLGQLQALLRLGLGVFFVLWIGPRADLALAGQTVAVGLVIVAGTWELRRRLTRPLESGTPDSDDPAGWGYAVRSLGVLAAAGILMNADVILAKRYLDPALAGSFARAATLARAIVFLPAPIALALFPRVASSKTLRHGDRHMLQHAAGLVVLMILAGVGGAYAAMPWIYPLLTGGQADAQTLVLARHLLLALAPVGLVILLLNFALAQHRFAVCLPVGVCAVAYLVAVAFWHRTPGDIVLALAVSSLLALVSLSVSLRAYLWRGDPPETSGLA